MVVNVVLPIGVFWKKSGTSRNIFSTLGERYCVTRANLSTLIWRSGMRTIVLLT